MKDLIKKIHKLDDVKIQKEAKLMAPLTLAYMGDAIFEAYIRNYLITKGDSLVKALHKNAILYVKAKAQAEIVHELEKQLTEEEWGIVKKGRNQKPSSSPKNADMIDYKYATGFESLLGYLFYDGKIERLIEIMEKSVEIINEKNNN
ncbi:Mini-ribonuclease 3 [Natronincola ferrireducens]|uniref:Mini-ribonuclease 3 n=1 Tax=Natronincola ferrireducens TaxID=393762 RepID=A0A1G9INE1_9FIRM|nr:ribonuclease III domain-containing protein [Natronincola ferrireducens]SDL26809.1 ribonuclease-3 family protein [Natronincola ferrireducens]